MTTLSVPYALPGGFTKTTQLHTRQIELLRTLIKLVQNGVLKEPIVPFPLKNPSTHYVVYLKGEDSFKFKRISDLDALCDADFMSFRWNRIGTTKLYTITKAGYKAVEYGFFSNSGIFGSNTNLTEMLAAMSGGTIQIRGLAEHLELIDIALNPILRLETVNLLINSLLQEAEAALPRKPFNAYSHAVRQFEQAVLRERPDMTQIKELGATLTLSHNLSGPFSFTTRAWVFIYPLFLICNIRLHSPTAKGSTF